MHAACKRLIVATHMHGFSLQLSLVVYTTLIPSRKLVLYTCSSPPYIACPKLGHDRALQSTTLCNLHEFLKLEKQTTNAWQQTKSLTDEENRLFGVYSKTSNNGPSEKRTTSLQRTAHLPPIDFTIELIHYEPPRSGHLSTPNNGH